MDLEVITFKFTANMRGLAFQLYALQLFSKAQLSYTIDIFQLETFENSVVALCAHNIGPGSWDIPYSYTLDGNKNYGTLNIAGLSDRNTGKLLAKSNDASSTDSSACCFGFPRKRSGNEDLLQGKQGSEYGKEHLVQPLVLSETVMIKIIEKETEKHGLSPNDVHLTYQWSEKDGPQLHIKPQTLPYTAYTLSFENGMLGLILAKIRFDASLSRDELMMNEVQNLYFDFGKLATTVPEKMYNVITRRLKNKGGIDIVDTKRMTFNCPKKKAELKSLMPSITFEFRSKLLLRSYILSSEEYIQEYIEEVTEQRVGNEVHKNLCYLTLVPHNKPDWIIGATFAKQLSPKIRWLPGRRLGKLEVIF